MIEYLNHSLDEKEKVTGEFLTKMRTRMHNEPVVLTSDMGNDSFV